MAAKVVLYSLSEIRKVDPLDVLALLASGSFRHSYYTTVDEGWPFSAIMLIRAFAVSVALMFLA